MRALAPWLVLAGLTLAASPGCSEKDDSGDDLINDDIPPGGPSTSGADTGDGGADADTGPGAGETGGDQDACKSSDECTGGLMCVAPFSGSRRGAFECVGVCVDLVDDTRWCADDSACCSPTAICSNRGYCMPGGGTGSTSTSG